MEYQWQTILGTVPSKANQYKVVTRSGHGSLAKQKALIEYEKQFYIQVGAYRNLKIDDLFEFHCRVFYPSMRSDIDNALKIVLDCLQKTSTITNDNRCIKIVAEKFVDKERPRIEFRIVTVCMDEKK